MTGPRGSVALREWREARGLSQGELARLIGCSQPTVSQYEAGQKRPGAPIAAAVEAITEGAVPASAWFTADEAALVAAARMPRPPADLHTPEAA